MARKTTESAPLSVASPRSAVAKTLSSIALLAVGIAFLIPLAWIVLSAFNTDAKVSLSMPEKLSFDNFTAVMTWEMSWQPLLNSMFLSMGTGVVTVVAALLAAYPLSRYQFRFRKSFMYTILFGTCLPITAIMVPVYSLFVALKLLDSTWGAIFFMSAATLPMAIWMMKNFMDSVPVSLEEAAWVDGASPMRALARIVVPLMKQGIGVVFVFVFTGAWGNFFVPFVLLFSPSKQPAAVAIFNFFGQYGAVAYGQLAAFSILYAMPAVVLYVVTQRLSGGSFAMAGAVKG